jgi:hypothetical protein
MNATLDRPSQPLISVDPIPTFLDTTGQSARETILWEEDFPVLRPEVHCMEQWLDLNA